VYTNDGPFLLKETVNCTIIIVKYILHFARVLRTSARTRTTNTTDSCVFTSCHVFANTGYWNRETGGSRGYYFVHLSPTYCSVYTIDELNSKSFTCRAVAENDGRVETMSGTRTSKDNVLLFRSNIVGEGKRWQFRCLSFIRIALL